MRRGDVFWVKFPAPVGRRPVVLVARDGSTIAVQDSAAPIQDRNGQIVGAVMVFHDVRQERQLHRRLAYLASHDALTGFINRRELEERLSAVLAAVKSEPAKTAALLYMDLDQFKVVNDTCGHAAGDELLKELSTLLQPRVRESDTLARLGGDEFGVLLEGCSLEKAQYIAGDMLSAIRNYRFNWHEKAFAIGASIGVAAITPSSASAQRVLSTADTACYSAKEGGRNRVHVFRYADEELADRREQMNWIARLTQALEKDSFALYYQPYLPLSRDPPPQAHIELLLRLVDDDGQVILPGSFIPAAERYNLMPALDKWVIKNAFEAYPALTSRFGAKTVFAINLSGRSMSEEKFEEFIHDQAKLHQVPPQSFCFEITETAAVNQLRKAAAFISGLRSAGFKFALDDFGAGMSSFGYLKNLPVDFLKIDGGFVKDIDSDLVCRTMVTSVNQIGHAMGIRTIAEFVDRPEVLKELRAIGVDFAQGYLISKPQPLTQVHQAEADQQVASS